MSLKIIFAGTPEFACPTLSALLDSSHQVVSVYTQPDRPAGRGRQLHASPIKQLALSRHLPMMQPTSLRSQAVQQQLAHLQPDLMVVVAYGLLLPKAVLDIPRLGCINVHASLLPRWRGASPIQQAILHGDTVTGITIMQMDEGLDTGAILATAECEIHADDNTQSLHDRLAEMGARLCVNTVNQLEKGEFTPIAQDAAQATYAAKLQKTDALIDWSKTADAIVHQIRAFNPWPVAYTYLNGELMKIWHATALSQNAEAPFGTILEVSPTAFVVAAGEAAVRIEECQLPGKKRLAASDFINAHYRELIPQKTRFTNVA